MEHNYITAEELALYVEGKLPVKREQEIEALAMKDPLVAEAITEMEINAGASASAEKKLSIEEFRKTFKSTHNALGRKEPILRSIVNKKNKVETAQGYSDGASAKLARPLTDEAPSFWEKNKKWLSIAAILAVVVVPILLWENNNEITSDRLFQAYYEPAPAITERGDNPNSSLFYEALQNYKSEIFPLAFQQWESWELENPDNTMAGVVNIYQAICQIEMTNYEAALLELNEPSTTSSILSREQAAWYIGLVNLKLGRLEEAKRILGEIGVTVGHFNQKQARELVEKI